MPRISEFYGIVIAMYYREHGTPHFHATYGEYSASISIASGAPIAGALPRRALGMVREWTIEHQAELQANWERARFDAPLATIDPLP
jgi:hypothetical protein